MDKQTDSNRFTAEQKIELRKKQWEVAMDGDVKMLIWLGKQYLGQSESPEVKWENPITGVHFVDSDGKIIDI